MKTILLILFCILVQFHSNAQHVFKASLAINIVDASGVSISKTALLRNDYQFLVQKGDGTIFKESNMDSLGNIHVFRNDIMPEDVGKPWNIVLVNTSDTMFVQHHILPVSNDAPLEFSISNGSYVSGDYVYDIIRATSSDIELGKKIIDFETLFKMLEDNQSSKEWFNLLKSKRNQCISLINNGEYKKIPWVTFSQSDSKKLIDSLRFVDQIPSCVLSISSPIDSNSIFWRIVKLKELAINDLIDAIDDTTKNNLSTYTVGNIAFKALNEIIPGIPKYKLSETYFDHVGCGDCYFWNVLSSDIKYRQQFKANLKQWYSENEFVWTEWKGDEDFCKNPNNGYFELYK